jgi:hypothetical protein
MNACHNLLIGCLVALLAPNLATAQESYHPAVYAYNEGGSAISSNVPLNEINSHAYRHFQRLFPTGTSNEYWYVSADGYQVSFALAGRQCQAYFDRHGAYRYSLKYYPGKEIPRLAGDPIKAKYPEYRIDVVTEITDGEKTFYLVKIVNPVSIKTLSVSDGRIDLLEELTNAGPEIPLISRRSYP